jgi:peroxygenase
VDEIVMAEGQSGNEINVETVAPMAPVTYRRTAISGDVGVEKPHVPRAMEATGGDYPRGTPDYNHNGYSVLQQHIAFFDRNNDGVIYPWETFQGFHALGFNFIISFIGMLFIHSAQSYPTLDSWIPSLWFPVYIKNIHRAKHGSDTEVYDTEGRFVPYKFEEIFSKYAKTEKNRLTFSELMEMTAANRNVADPFGWIATKGEWSVTFWLLKDKDGLISKESIRGMFDGSIFKKVEKMRKSKSQ